MAVVEYKGVSMVKNIVFDVGNVLVQWNPITVVANHFPEADAAQLSQDLFKSPTWFDLNLGKMTVIDAIKVYQKTLGISKEKLSALMEDVKASLVPIENSFELLKNLHQSQYSLYALTDNVHELVTYLKKQYSFWNYFRGAVVSAEVGYLRPSSEIYLHLLTQYDLEPNETVFIDDHLPNVEGARLAGMHAIQFETAAQCATDLKVLQVLLSK
jgi:putative hydrolase of the HAD superfamily